MPLIDVSCVERVFREQYGRAVAVLVRMLGDIDLAEECVQDAFVEATDRWPSAGLPPSPAGWILTTARNRAVDRLRREARRPERHAQAELLLAAGLLALMLLIESRRAARSTPHGGLVLLAQQDRGVWDRSLIAEGEALVRQCLRRGEPGPYQIQAAIQAVHTDSPTAARTDWAQIVRLYDQLLHFTPTPVVALNRAVAVAEVSGPAAALALVDRLPLDDYYMLHAVRADLLRRLRRFGEAAEAYDAAIKRTTNVIERVFLQRCRRALDPS